MSNLISKILLIVFIATLSSAFTINNHPDTDPKSKALIKALYKRNGGRDKLASKKDVEFTYIYHDFAKGKDISTERYIFNGGSSWGKYSQHEVNVMPGKKGMVAQCLMNGKPAISVAGNPIMDQKAVGGTAFLRSANYFWFTMTYKLNDPGTIHKYLGQENVNGTNYDKVSLTYDSGLTNKETNDEFVLYFNPETTLVDQLMFSVPAMGVNQPILKMEIEYTKIDGVYVPAKRTVSAPDAKGKYAAVTIQYTKDVKFNNKFTAADLKI